MCSHGNAEEGRVWAIVLAAGQGTRLRSLTDDGTGQAVPKQYCSVAGGETLLAQTLARARSVVEYERIVMIVSAAHAHYWRSSANELPAGNIIVQPEDRGTGIGILLPALAVLERDPRARLLILPSDHYVADEDVLASAICRALDAISHHRRGVALLGMEADEPDPELGYIVAEAAEHAALRDVRRFVEKPSIEQARRLCEERALWNSFIVVCRAVSLVGLYRSRYPDAVEILQGTDLREATQLADAYRKLPRLDFSSQIAAGQENRLAVMPVGHCGWNDLGTPRRLAQTVARHPALLRHDLGSSSVLGAAHVNLVQRLVRTCPSHVSDAAVCGSIGGQEPVGVRELPLPKSDVSLTNAGPVNANVAS